VEDGWGQGEDEIPLGKVKASAEGGDFGLLHEVVDREMSSRVVGYGHLEGSLGGGVDGGGGARFKMNQGGVGDCGGG